MVVAARSESALATLVTGITVSGGQATAVVCDAADFAQVENLATIAVRTYGRIDTWVNAAAVSVWATFEDTTPEEFRRVTEINYLGQVHGALAALPHLRAAGGGAIIAVSSVESIVSLPLHAAYTASKHAVEGAIDALRRDLLVQRAPISVTSVKPATISTPLFTNSRNKMTVKPKGPRPIYHPDVVARCIVYAAEHPVRDLFAGGSGLLMAINQFRSPRRMDRYLSRLGVRQEKSKDQTPEGSPGNLLTPSSDDRVEGDYRGRRVSLYTWWQTHPRLRAGVALSAMAGPVLVRLLRVRRPQP